MPWVWCWGMWGCGSGDVFLLVEQFFFLLYVVHGLSIRKVVLLKCSFELVDYVLHFRGNEEKL